MKTNTRNDIYEFISSNNPTGIKLIQDFFGISKEIIHRHLKKLIEEGKIYKIGTAPKVFYFPNIEIFNDNLDISESDIEFLNKNFIEFTPDGRVLKGIDGFDNWCKKRGLDTFKELEIYKSTLEKYNKFKNSYGLINGFDKMKSSFSEVYLDEIYYIDFYSIEKYGKTLLGNLMLYGKQTADKEILFDILNIIKNPIKNLINKENIDSVAFIPPSINRKVQILDEIKKGLKLNLRELKLLKIFKQKVVSQKSLNKKEDRIINARETIFIGDRNFSSNKIILIDDAVGSGSTLNETAKKIKDLGISNYVVGIAVVGSYKGFEVINEV